MAALVIAVVGPCTAWHPAEKQEGVFREVAFHDFLKHHTNSLEPAGARAISMKSSAWTESVTPHNCTIRKA